MDRLGVAEAADEAAFRLEERPHLGVAGFVPGLVALGLAAADVDPDPCPGLRLGSLDRLEDALAPHPEGRAHREDAGEVAGMPGPGIEGGIRAERRAADADRLARAGCRGNELLDVLVEAVADVLPRAPLAGV